MIPKEAIMSFDKGEKLITLQYRGSIAHGMFVPQSDPNSIDDKDLVGCFIAPLDYYLGFNPVKDSKEIKFKEYDSVYFEFKKLVELLMKGNPNVLSMLWIEEKNMISSSWQWKKIIENRDKFSSKQVYHSFVGYARGQMHRMTAFKFEGYMGDKRKKLVEQFGFDCKNAAHLIRLLNMAIEFLTEGRLYVERKDDAPFLLDIKKGKYTLQQVKDMADDLFNLAQTAYVKSSLPNNVDKEYISNLTTNILKGTFN